MDQDGHSRAGSSSGPLISSVRTEASPRASSEDISRLPGSKESGDPVNAGGIRVKLWRL
jgi:hypothetical protein